MLNHLLLKNMLLTKYYQFYIKKQKAGEVKWKGLKCKPFLLPSAKERDGSHCSGSSVWLLGLAPLCFGEQLHHRVFSVVMLKLLVEGQKCGFLLWPALRQTAGARTQSGTGSLCPEPPEESGALGQAGCWEDRGITLEMSLLA